MDPRVKATPAELALQHALALRLARALDESAAVPAVPARETGERLARTRRELTQLLGMVEAVDAAPTPAVRAAVDETIAGLEEQLRASRELQAAGKEKR
jgi:hypothetical protein